MTEKEQDRLEAGLSRMAPGRVPADLMQRLRAARVEPRPAELPMEHRPWRWAEWFAAWRGLAFAEPAVAILLVALLVWRAVQPAAAPGKSNLGRAAGLQANAVHVDHSLVASFDTVAQLPGGEPVRFRCRKWQDDVVVHDDANGVVISQSTPRVEVVPVRFETY
jgi:hypothetical protein